MKTLALAAAFLATTFAAEAQTTTCTTDQNSGNVTCSSSGTYGQTKTTRCFTDPNSGVVTCTTE